MVVTAVRVPEPEIVMESADAVEAFHRAGETAGALYPIYHLNATQLSRRLPEGARVLDAFCGSGRFLRHLLLGRPDLEGVGIDLSERMLSIASASLTEAGLESRVVLLHGDAREAAAVVTEPVAVVCSLSALHHCPTSADLIAVLRSMYEIRKRDGAGVWLFDLVRPDEKMIRHIPRGYELASGRPLERAFKADWETSLRAGWTVEEFSLAAVEAGLDLEARSGDYSQLHIAEPAGRLPGAPWRGPAPEEADRKRVERLAEALGMTDEA
ncbi:MAG: class I SAM-dependent methyltransferase [Microthrixaceae bacterium]